MPVNDPKDLRAPVKYRSPKNRSVDMGLYSYYEALRYFSCPMACISTRRGKLAVRLDGYRVGLV
jgi:hypothetical protein